jgi:Tfp pilus assembly protein PilN
MAMFKFSECSKVVQTFIAVGTVATALTAAAVPAVWALDTRYVTIASVEKAFLERDIRDIRRDIRKLEFLKSKNQATELQLWELEQLKQELEELQQ